VIRIKLDVYFQRKFLNFAVQILKIDHSLYGILLLMHQLVLNTLVDRWHEANLTFPRRLIDDLIDSPKLLKLINFKVLYFHVHHIMFLFSIHVAPVNQKNQLLYAKMSIENKKGSLTF